MRLIVRLLTLIVVLILASNVSGSHVFYGTVIAPDNTIIEARVDGVSYLEWENPSKVYNNTYISSVFGDVEDGSIITFYVDGFKTNETYPYQYGEYTNLNLTVSEYAIIENVTPDITPTTEPTISPNVTANVTANVTTVATTTVTTTATTVAATTKPTTKKTTYPTTYPTSKSFVYDQREENQIANLDSQTEESTYYPTVTPYKPPTTVKATTTTINNASVADSAIFKSNPVPIYGIIIIGLGIVIVIIGVLVFRKKYDPLE